MKKIFSFLKQNKDLVFIFIISLFLSSPYLIDICSGYLNYNIIDLQSFLLWDYSLAKHLIPYKDTPYPYGLFQYYKESNLLLLFIYYSIAPLCLTSLFYIFKKTIKNKYFLYIAFILFYIFVLNITGFTIFARYGIFIVLSLLFARFLSSQKNISKKFFFYVGITLGLFFSLINDQGVYLLLSYIVVFFVNDLIKNKNSNIFSSSSYYILTIKKIIFLILGFFIGIFPLIIFLTSNNSTTQFFNYFKDLKDVIIIAKTPFFNFISTKDNLFTIFTLYFSILFLFIKIVFLKYKYSLFTLIQISLIVDILILEQKSIIRSISTQITFVAFILLILIFYELTQFKKISYFTNKMKKIIYLFMILTILFAFQLSDNSNKYSLNKIDKSLGMLVSNSCYENNLKIFLSKNSTYLNVYKYFKAQTKFNGEIFSFPPRDSVFYILFNQIPPYYNTIWNSSIINSQNTIKYIEENNIGYVFLNIDVHSIQDGVPDYIRIPLVYRYILNNFYPISLIDNYLILKKDSSKDFFGSNLVKEVKDYNNHLLNFYIYKIPYSEGLYKYKNLKENGRMLINTTKINKVDLFLKNNKLNSENKVIVITSNVSSKSSDLNTLKLTTDKGYSTTIIYNTCKKNAKCVINLANAPLFYKNRVIKKIITDKDFDGNIEIFEINKKVNLW